MGSPLVRALDEARVPQPRRIWCFDADEAALVGNLFGMPVTVEQVDTGVRVTAGSITELRGAVETLASNAHGVLVEQPVQAVDIYSVLVVDGVAAAIRSWRRHAAPEGTARAAATAELAVKAVAALGGGGMSVDLLFDAEGSAFVHRVVTAPDLAGFGAAGVRAVADAILARVEAERARARHGGRVLAHH